MDSQVLKTAIGVISGTSMDGIDVSIVESDGDTVVRPGPGRTYPYDPLCARGCWGCWLIPPG